MNILITGGAGFVGCNLAARGLRDGHHVAILDNLSRPGSEKNLAWLRGLGPIEFHQGDVRDFALLRELAGTRPWDAVFHQAAQVAVTTSVADPRTDFEVNASGTLNVLEAVRLSGHNPVLVFASTNKVYGDLGALSVALRHDRYALPDLPSGIAETMPLDFHSPYACSKGAADQYVLDYRRIYGLRIFVFRQSCIYGPRQMGLEDQGWVAWFAICGVLGRPITIYGDGKQVRDILHVDDLAGLYYRAVQMEGQAGRRVFNVGGGPARAVSLLEVLSLIERQLGRRLDLRFAQERPGDQRVYISDIREASYAFQWRPKWSWEAGVASLLDWVRENVHLFERSAAAPQLHVLAPARQRAAA